MNEQIMVLIVDAQADVLGAERDALERAGFAVNVASSESALIEMLQSTVPQVILAAEQFTALGGGHLLELVKRETFFGHIPAIVLLEEGTFARGIDWLQIPADDYLVRPVPQEELLNRVRLNIARAQRDINANPLTGLPGNVSILREAERRLASAVPFAIAHLDIDNFKPFNDKYGFARGDEVLRMTARILTNVLGTIDGRDVFIGHVGGDDFIFILPPKLVDRACREVLDNFDVIVANFYDDEDRARGAIQSVDRQGRPQEFPLMTCSIGVIDTTQTPVRHLADISARAAEVKRFAKSLPGSNYLIDRRK